MYRKLLNRFHVILIFVFVIILISSCTGSNEKKLAEAKLNTTQKSEASGTFDNADKSSILPTPESTPEQTPEPKPASDAPPVDEPKYEVLPVGSQEELYRVLNERYQQNRKMLGTGSISSVAGVGFGVTVSASAEVAQSVQDSSSVSSAPLNEFSSTNIQVEGVDESDIVKTDGEYIYGVKLNKLIITKANPADDMKVVSVTDFKYSHYNSAEIYVDNDILVVMARIYINKPYLNEVRYIDESTGQQATTSQLQYNPENAVKVLIYNISDKTKPELLKDVEIDGSYVSSRKVNSYLYIITNKSAFFRVSDDKPVLEMPVFLDTAIGEHPVYMDISNIYYFTNQNNTSYMITAAIDLNNLSECVKLKAYLGAGSNIYASKNDLYVAAAGQPTAQPSDMGTYYQNNTVIYKFALNGSDITFTARGQVPGSILNQFSMDEYGRYFRIATTKNAVLEDGKYGTKNNLYVLDENMQLTGKIEDIAPGEKIYSTRFMGQRAYMVTFRKVDPLFVIDLNNPANPQILGALKIPGYSDYLHPYDENHIIGFGKDTVEVNYTDGAGNVINSSAFYQGMKLALFDVTNVNNPIQLFCEIIGDRGTNSELLQNHKALLFSKEKNLLAFPVTLYEIKNKAPLTDDNQSSSATKFGEFTFQGAYVYNMDLQNGFTLKGRITHLNENDYKKAGQYYYNSPESIKRILYINDTLYTVSDSFIRANAISDLTQKGQVSIP